jgi:dolichyl-diphosphooligosaccharide--protein glycosyltransferase
LSGTWVKVLVIGLVLYPNVGLSLLAMRIDLGPEKYWYEAMAWLRQNTPEPFPDPNAYYARYEKPRRGTEYPYPASAYGVMSWWDYGNLITTLGRRIPNSNPAQSGARDAARFYLAQDESSANGILDRVGARYVIANSELPTWHIPGQINVMGKLQSMPFWIRRDSAEFHEGYYQRTESGRLLPVTVYYPEYYRTLGSRLYLFTGQAVTPQNSTWVITYAEQPGGSGATAGFAGRPRRIITESKQFATYEEAVEYLKTQPPNSRLVGLNPFASCVPLEALKNYKLVYDSRATLFSPEQAPHPLLMPIGRLPHVRIFEYLRPEETLGKK